MVRVADITAFLAELAPPELAEEWDNVGFLLGYSEADVAAVITCLTLTPDVAAEAIDENVQLIVSHHPILFRPVQQVTSETTEGQMLLDLISAGIAVYSPHTSYDSSMRGINQQLSERLELSDIRVLRPLIVGTIFRDDSDSTRSATAKPGAGRFGDLPNPMKLAEFNQLVKQRLGISNLQFVGDASSMIQRVGIACGSAAEFIHDAQEHDCDVLLTGEARFHACLESRTSKIPLVLAGHYATERPAMENLAVMLAKQFPNLQIWASNRECDPVQWD